jgi:hypothetical protein
LGEGVVPVVFMFRHSWFYCSITGAGWEEERERKKAQFLIKTALEVG